LQAKESNSNWYQLQRNKFQAALTEDWEIQPQLEDILDLHRFSP